MDKISKILLFTALLSVTAFSQKLTEMHIVGNAEFISSELIDKSIKDANGETCAGLIIQSDLTGLNYTSYNGIVKVNKNAGKDFLFLSPDERVVEVFCEGFVSLKIILNDYGIKLESGKVWQLKITGEKKNLSNLIPVTFSINPKDANIIVDGDDKNKERIFKLSTGKHSINISLNGYKTIDKEIEVSEDNYHFEFVLKEVEPQLVRIITNQNYVKIFINNVEKGEAPKDIFTFPGKYKIKLSKNGYFDVEKEIEVIEGQKNEFQFELTKNSGQLNISVEPKDAQIFINKEDYSGKNIIDLALGKYKIEVIKDNYYSISEVIDITKLSLIEKKYKLIPKVGELQITTQPIGVFTQILKDGKVINSVNGSSLIRDLLIGEYTLISKEIGFETKRKNIIIEENKTAVVELVLKRNDLDKNDSEDISNYDSVMVYGGITYHIVKIGDQRWLKENLDVNHFRNGDIIPEATTEIEWKRAAAKRQPAWCYYENDLDKGNKQGKLYNWYAISDPRGFAPWGCHMPSLEEFEKLKESVGGKGNTLKGIGEGSFAGAGTNTTRFSALLAGDRTGNADFRSLGSYANFWSSTECNLTNASCMSLRAIDASIILNDYNKAYGLSVRCIVD